MNCGLGTNTDYRPTDLVWNIDKEQDADYGSCFKHHRAMKGGTKIKRWRFSLFKTGVSLKYRKNNDDLWLFSNKNLYKYKKSTSVLLNFISSTDI